MALTSISFSCKLWVLEWKTTSKCFLLTSLFLGTLSDLQAKKIEITLEHAITTDEKTHGLMYRVSMPENHGMAFDHPSPRFWMKNTLMDLSLAYLDEKKVIKEIHHLKAYPKIQDPYFFSKHAAVSSFKPSYALEMNAHWFEKNSVKVGDRAVWDTSGSSGYILTQE